jgi:S-adenosylmethionine:tRNA ribosyltransferase-isomerase
MVGDRVMTFDVAVVPHASEPPEARGLRRDEVKLMVSEIDGGLHHLRFHQLPSVLRRGDLLVVNASGTLNASIEGERTFGMAIELHLSTQLPGGLWSVEVRARDREGSKPLELSLIGEVLQLAGAARASILAPYPYRGDPFARSRLWVAALELPLPLEDYLDRYGEPIRYGYVPRAWPSSFYQTMFASEPGSAEMPSAGRPFTTELVRALQHNGIEIAPLVLHTGVSSLEHHEPPYEERFAVSSETAARVNAAHASGGRVIAVGTTAVRALETVTDERGVTHPGHGWTDLVITREHPMRAVDGILTGLHEPRATHLAIIDALVAASRSARAGARFAGERGGRLLERAYQEAIARGYLWHEFGDSHLVLADR